MAQLALSRGDKFLGVQNTIPNDPSLGPFPVDPESQIATLISMVSSMQKLVEGKADKNEIVSQIAYSDEGVLIAGNKIALAGQVTFLDYVRDLNGQSTGVIDPSITIIRGGVIQTEAIIGPTWGAGAGMKIDLDNETITIGGSASPDFYAADGDLQLTGTLKAGSIIATSVTVDGTQIGTIKTNAAAGYSIQQKLEVTGTTVLKGVVTPEDTGAFKVGSITWNSSTGALTGGSGIALTEYGIIGAASGSSTFSILASNGSSTWSGDITTSGSVLATGVTSSGGYTGTIIGSTSTSGRDGVVGYSLYRDGVRGDTEDGNGVFGWATVAGNGVKGVSTNLSGRGGYFSGSGIGLEVDGNVTNLNTVLNVSGYTTISDDAEITGSLSTYGRIHGIDDMVVEKTLYAGTDATSGDSSIVLGLYATGQTGKNTLVFSEGSAGSQLSNQFHLYGQLDSGQSKTVIGIVAESTVETGTGAFTGINQIPIYYNGARWLLGCIPG